MFKRNFGLRKVRRRINIKENCPRCKSINTLLTYSHINEWTGQLEPCGRCKTCGKLFQIDLTQVIY